MLPSAPYRPDQQARALRERLELAAVRTDDVECARAARDLVAFCGEHPEYRLCALVPFAGPPTAPEPSDAKQITSRYDARCKRCQRLIVAGETCMWTPGERGITCPSCALLEPGGEP
jgi:hypothetical protein